MPAPAPAPGPVPVTASVPEASSSCDLGNTAQDTPQISTKPKIIDNSSMGMSVARRAQSAPLPKPDDFLSEPFTCRGLGTAWACQVNVGQRRGVPIAEARPSGTAGLQTSVAGSFIAAPPVPRPLQDSSRKTQRVQPDRHPSLFRRGDRPTRDTLWRFAGTEKEKTMKCLTILCLSLGLADCCCTGPYASANGDGPVVDLSACADSADLRVDPLCHPLTRTQRK